MILNKSLAESELHHLLSTHKYRLRGKLLHEVTGPVSWPKLPVVQVHDQLYLKYAYLSDVVSTNIETGNVLYNYTKFVAVVLLSVLAGLYL